MLRSRGEEASRLLDHRRVASPGCSWIVTRSTSPTSGGSEIALRGRAQRRADSTIAGPLDRGTLVLPSRALCSANGQVPWACQGTLCCSRQRVSADRQGGPQGCGISSRIAASGTDGSGSAAPNQCSPAWVLHRSRRWPSTLSILDILSHLLRVSSCRGRTAAMAQDRYRLHFCITPFFFFPSTSSSSSSSSLPSLTALFSLLWTQRRNQSAIEYASSIWP